MSPSVDAIALDAIFSPVLRVRYKVENTRVGQATDLDKLLLTVDTDGSITPSDAFEEASAILVNQYTALAGKTRITSNEPVAMSTTSNNSELTSDMLGDEPLREALTFDDVLLVPAASAVAAITPRRRFELGGASSRKRLRFSVGSCRGQRSRGPRKARPGFRREPRKLSQTGRDR